MTGRNLGSLCFPGIPASKFRKFLFLSKKQSAKPKVLKKMTYKDESFKTLDS